MLPSALRNRTRPDATYAPHRTAPSPTPLPRRCPRALRRAAAASPDTAIAADCATAAAELKTAVRALGGDPEDSGSVAGALHRGWVDVKSMLTGKDEEAVLNEAERGEDHALKAYKDAIEKINKHNLLGIRDLVERQYHGVQRNHDQVKALRNQARAQS